MFGRVGFGVHDLFGREGPEVAHLLQAMEESGPKNSSFLTRRFYQTHSISILGWMDVMNDGGTRTSSLRREERQVWISAISTVQTGVDERRLAPN
jgi:hypothetical protein